LRDILLDGEMTKFNPYHLGPGPGGGQFTTAAANGARSGDAKSPGYVTKLSEEEILKQAQENPKTPGWLQPKDVRDGNEKQCVSLVRAVIPGLPPSSKWRAGDPLTPESVKDLTPGTAIATFQDGRYKNSEHGNHDADPKDGEPGIHVLDQYAGRRGGGQAEMRFYPFDPTKGSSYIATQFSVIN
jgi:hypothetical protein